MKMAENYVLDGDNNIRWLTDNLIGEILKYKYDGGGIKIRAVAGVLTDHDKSEVKEDCQGVDQCYTNDLLMANLLIDSGVYENLTSFREIMKVSAVNSIGKKCPIFFEVSNIKGLFSLMKSFDSETEKVEFSRLFIETIKRKGGYHFNVLSKECFPIMRAEKHLYQFYIAYIGYFMLKADGEYKSSAHALFLNDGMKNYL